MKINFDSIITKSFDKVINQSSTKPQYFSYRKPNHQQSTFFTQNENDAELILSKNQTLFSSKNNNPKFNNNQYSKQGGKHQIKDYFWLASQIKEKIPKQNFTQSRILNKQKKKGDLHSLTDRLTLQTNRCNKTCGAMQGSHQLKKNMKQFMQLQQPQIFIQYESSNAKTRKVKQSLSQSAKTLSKTYKKQLHDRLYKEWISKQFRDSLLVQKYQRLYDDQNDSKQKEKRTHIKQEAHTSKSSSELKDFRYIKFYDRLDELIENQKTKADYLKNNLSVGITKDSERLFKPSIQKSKRTLNMGKTNYFKPKTMKNRDKKIQTPHHTRSLYLVAQTLNTSFESLDKSIQIIQNRQQNFLKKIKKIFTNQEDKKAQISPERISKLTQVQFSIFFPLIQSIQSNQEEYTDRQFYKKLKSYYKSMNAKDKQQLRRHQIQLTNQKKARKIELQKKSNIQKDRAPNLQKPFALKNFKDYHQILKTFV